MADERRIRYLTELDSSLPMPLERRAEVIEEINAHLDDAVAAHLERGGSPEHAEDRAQNRLGSPRDLAADLARPEQSAWRLLAAVGAGVRTGIGHWVYGFLLGTLVLLLAVYLLAAVVQLSGRLLETEWQFQFTDEGWNTLITAGAIAMGLYFAGRAMPDAVSIASRHLVTEVRPRVVVVGTAAAAGLLVLVLDVPQNLASVVGITLAPAAFVLGAYRPDLLPDRVRRSYLAIIGAAVLLPTLGLLTLGEGSGGSIETADGALPDRGLAIVGPWWVDPMTGEGPPLWSIALGDQSGDGRGYEWELNGDAALDGLRGLRVEAWHSDARANRQLDPRYDQPFAVAPIERDGRTLSASLDTTSTPGVNAWELIVTGVGSDGTRYVVDAGTILSSTFTGSVWDWVVVVVDR